MSLRYYLDFPFIFLHIPFEVGCAKMGYPQHCRRRNVIPAKLRLSKRVVGTVSIHAITRYKLMICNITIYYKLRENLIKAKFCWTNTNMYLVSSQKSTLFLFLPLNLRKKLWYNLFLLLYDAASFFFHLEYWQYLNCCNIIVWCS